MSYTIRLDHDLKIIRYKHIGTISSEDISYAWEEFLNMKEFTEQQYNLFSDYRDATINIPLSFLEELLSYMNKIKHIVKGKKQCLIVSDPQSTAASLIFENEANTKIGFIVQVFSTEDAGIKWLCN